MNHSPRALLEVAKPSTSEEKLTPEQAQLVIDNLPLVGYVVSETAARLPAHVGRDDLSSAGATALVLAARSFDAARGVPFPRYATLRIRGALLDELRRSDWASRSVRSKARQRHTAVETLSNALGRTPSNSELANHLGVDPGQLASGEDDVHRAVVLSLSGFAEEWQVEELAPVGDVSPLDHILANERIGYIHDAVAALPERLRTVVVRYFFEELPMAEIAEELGVTESRISQMRAEALRLVREVLERELEGRDTTSSADVGCAARRRLSYAAEVAARGDYKSRVSARPLAVPVRFTRTA
jgi:RNA polymerase sigma factor for flagellar operon FliA